ncbi:MAG: beta strand repeat-containing protein, partial [Acidovorax sp.]
MAVARQEQALLIKLVISMLGIAPGSAYLPVVEKGFEDLGRNLSDTASALAGLPQFKALYPVGMSGEAFATHFLAGMGLQSDAGLHRLAADLFNAGTSPQQIILAAVLALESPALPPQYAPARGLLENKAQVAYYHAQILGRAETDFAALAKVLDKVTQDPASVEAAKLVLSQPPASGGGDGGPLPFAATKGVGDIASITGAGTQISVAEAGGTFTFTSSGGVTGTATVAGPLAGIAVPGGSTLAIDSALADGKAFSGAGTTLVVANPAGEDLTAFTGSGAGGFVLTSGQNYTLTAAQAAIGRIGSTGAAGTLTDGGTTTVRDTLAALGSGVATTLKALGVDSVIASASPSDISAIAVAGIDSIVLAAGSYTLTAAQAALVDASTGSQTLTLTTQASGVLAASVESFVLGDFANSVSLGAATQNLSGPAGSATTLAIGGFAPTGTWALAHGADMIVATNGANITGVNSGLATTAEALDITGTVSMTQIQHQALSAVTGATGVVRITSGGTVNGKNDAASVAGYHLSSIASNAFVVAANKPGVNLTGANTNTTTVNLGGNTASGTWSLGAAGDILRVTDGADFAAVNGGLATTAENLVFTGAGTMTMTVEQHEAMVFSAASTSNTVQIASAGNFTAQSSIENYILFGAGANDVTLPAGSAGANLSAANGGAGASATVTIGGNTVTGTWALGSTADTIVASTGANISGVNGGAATTAENLTLTGGIIMAQAQHEGITSITAAGASDFVTITDGGAVTARAGVETYTVSGGGANSVTLLAGTNVNGVVGNATTVNTGGNTVTGIYTLANAADVLAATDGANIVGANTTTVERLA